MVENPRLVVDMQVVGVKRADGSLTVRIRTASPAGDRITWRSYDAPGGRLDAKQAELAAAEVGQCLTELLLLAGGIQGVLPGG